MTFSTFHCPIRFSRVRSWVCAVAVASTVIVAGSKLGLARPTEPSATDRQITLAVSMLMEQWHLSRGQLGDTISQRCLDTFIKELDPLKLFFYQSDIDEFTRNKDRLDDLFRRGDIRF